MGTETTDTLKEIEETRERLGQNIEQLEERLPKPPDLKKAAMVAGGLASLLIVLSKKKASKRARAVQEPVDKLSELIPGDLRDKIADVGPRGWAAGLAAVWMTMRITELRRLKKIQKAIVRRG